MKTLTNFLFFLFFFAVLFTSCKKDINVEVAPNFKTVADYDHRVVYDWNELFLEVERYAAGYRPCPTANALGYLGLANYEACITGMPEYASLAPLYSGLTIPAPFSNQEYHWPTVVNSVNYFMYSRLFASSNNTLFNKIKGLAERYETQFTGEISSTVFVRSKNHGEAVAAAIWEWMKTDPITFDGYNDPFVNSNWDQRLNEIGAWQPTNDNLAGAGKGMFTDWGKGRALAIKQDLRLCRHYSTYIGPYSEDKNSRLYAQALEVVSRNTPTLSYPDEWVGEFWSDDLLGLTFSPPARFIAIADQVYVKEDATLLEAILANARVGIALHDAAIGAWNSKYFYNLERPESYIKRLMIPDWEPNLDDPNSGTKGITPSFPAYPSGHATFGAAACEALASVFGYSYGMTDNCHINRNEFSGAPRTFGSFFEMAMENAWSRVPLGVHFRVDAEEGVRYGTEIGRAVNNLPWKK